MPVSRARSFAFIHVRKTAGTSLTTSLRAAVPDLGLAEKGMWDILRCHPRRRWLAGRLREAFPVNTLVDFPQWHLPADVVRAIVGPKVWNELFTFGFVRNPWDLVVSAYFFDRGELKTAEFQAERDRVAALLRCETFEDFVRIYPLLEPKDMTSVLGDERGNILVKFIGRMERLQEDFDSICRQIGLETVRLPTENRTVHRHYRSYYTADSRLLVERYFARDIERFGYQF